MFAVFVGIVGVKLMRDGLRRETAVVTHAVEDRSALVDKLAATLQARMLSGELVSGTRLRQEALAEEFGVSRTPIREALRKLQASGLVELQTDRGALVRGPSAREIRDAYEVRAELEGLAAELAAQRIQQAQLDGLHEAQSEFRETLARMMQVRSGGGASSRTRRSSAGATPTIASTS